jgi:hypothetical protein
LAKLNDVIFKYTFATEELQSDLDFSDFLVGLDFFVLKHPDFEQPTLQWWKNFLVPKTKALQNWQTISSWNLRLCIIKAHLKIK